MGNLKKEAKMSKLTELEQKRQAAAKVEPALKDLIRKHGYGVVNYAWTKFVELERQISKAEKEAEEAQAHAERLKRRVQEL